MTRARIEQVVAELGGTPDDAEALYDPSLWPEGDLSHAAWLRSMDEMEFRDWAAERIYYWTRDREFAART